MAPQQKRILVIESDPRMVNQYIQLFRKDGHTIDSCACVSEGVYKMKQTRFDCTIIDVEQSEMKGYEAVHILKKIDPNVQVIITATENTRELEIKVREEDIFYYYIKTFDHEELRLAVNNALSNPEKVRKH
jgi:DNA-binding NtrC family response regulator